MEVFWSEKLSFFILVYISKPGNTANNTKLHKSVTKKRIRRKFLRALFLGKNLHVLLRVLSV